MNYYLLQFACVDPGLRHCGVALFDKGDLYSAFLVRNPIESGRGYEVSASMGNAVVSSMHGYGESVIVEFPRIYPSAAQQKGDLNDLLDLAAVGGAIASRRVTETVFPSDWKGNVPKEVMTERIRRALTDEERARIEKCPASLMHNVLDAVGIGLHKLNRINRKVIHNG